VSYRGEPVAGPEVRQPLLRQRAQIVFQDPLGSLNPRLTVQSALREVLLLRGRSPTEASDEIDDLLARVGLSRDVASALPNALSGGQCQRVGIARALAMEPEFLILDEPVSALDVSVQARILNLLLDLQERLGLTYLFISHDMAVVRRMSDRILVLEAGRVVEAGPADRIVAGPFPPLHPGPPGRSPIGGPSRVGTNLAAAGGTPRDRGLTLCQPPRHLAHPSRSGACPSGQFGFFGR